MMGWLADTVLYTGVLIALVLLVRQSVARHFGPHMAYALWALPLLRFIMPPLILPAEFSPAPVDAASGLAGSGVENSGAGLIDTAFIAGVPKAAVSAPDAVPYLQGALLSEIVLLLWLSGAAVFLLWRTWTYRQMRADLLDEARPVGEAGAVRLVETPAVSAPVAFGVSDKVVALPMEFMGMENRTARDMAIEHELAHHRGWDLLANMLAQPILALHWFNPLAWLGWRAMRRDQEAACDARVMAARPAWEKAAYGQVIAGFAAGSRLALAAPMACPILGEKSIIHRLRSLNRLDISAPRRWAGRVMLGSAALALPLTASISYAEPSLAPKTPNVPTVPVAPEPVSVPADVSAPLAPLPLQAPAAPAVVVPPAPPQPPAAPEAPQTPQNVFAVSLLSSVTPSEEEEFNKVMLLRTGLERDLEFHELGTAVNAASGIALDCDGNTQEFTALDEEGIERHTEFCISQAMSIAAQALLEAREAVARDHTLMKELREEVLRSLDEEILRIEQDKAQSHVSACADAPVSLARA